MTPEQRSAIVAAESALIAGSASLTALAEAVRVLRESLDVAAPPAPSPAPEPPAPEPPAPPPAPIPAEGMRYRTQSKTLWTRVEQAQIPARLAGVAPLEMDRVGPTNIMVCARTDWPWRQPGGDWIDAAGTLHGDVPWHTAPLGAASGPAAAADYSVDVTAAVQRIHADGRWCVLYLRCPGHPRVISGATSADTPRLTLTHDDGSVRVIDCHVSAAISAGSAYPITAAREIQLPAMLEFSRPAKPVRSASLSLRVTQHWSGQSGKPVLHVYIADPPVAAPSVEHGIAAGAALDAGLVSHPAILGVHRIADDTPLSTIAETEALPSHLKNYNALTAFDPALYGTGAEDRGKLPHRSLGKWIGVDSRWSVVPSTYADEGFAPLAPGVGAVRIRHEREVSEDGAVVGYATSWPVSAKLFMPPQHFGRLREVYVRYYLRLGTPDGGPYIFDPSTRYLVRTQAGAALRWTDCAGKIGLMPAHDTTKGGVSGTSGGGRGWQMRMGYADYDAPGGPDTGGVATHLHWYDFIGNVPGHNYGANGVLRPGDAGLSPFGGPGGMVYAHQWYCIETRLKMNSVDQPAALPDGSPHYCAWGRNPTTGATEWCTVPEGTVGAVRQFWTPDGELDVWIDGRKTYSKRNLVLRSLPLDVRSGMNAQTYLPPAGDLGIRDLWFNWFHGGLTKSSRTRVLFIAGVAWGTEYIGPMRAA